MARGGYERRRVWSVVDSSRGCVACRRPDPRVVKYGGTGTGGRTIAGRGVSGVYEELGGKGSLRWSAEVVEGAIVVPVMFVEEMFGV